MAEKTQENIKKRMITFPDMISFFKIDPIPIIVSLYCFKETKENKNV